ncbi:MAG: hypothetical protein ACI3VQ_05650 [Faecousia sp.]
MIQIINGKKYSTETAEEIGEWESYPYSEYSTVEYSHEILYLKKTGEYFLWGEGGALTRYADEYENFSSRIIPISEEQARKWVLKKLPGERYIELYGDVKE